MNPIQAAVGRPYTVAVAVILTVIFSWLAVESIPVQLKPTLDTPIISLTTTFRGAAAVEVEELVTRELEDVLQNVEGLIEMTSTSSEGRSVILLELTRGIDPDLAVVDVLNQLSQVPDLPDEADEPIIDVSASSRGEERVMWITCRSSDSPDRIRELVEEEIEGQLSRVPGVSSILVAGGSEREVQVRVDLEKLAGRGVTLTELQAALTRGNVNLRGGTVETAERQLSVRTVGRVEEAARLEDIIVKETPSGSVWLSDVATVVTTYEEATGFVRANGVPSVALGIGRQAGANVVDLIEALDVKLEELNRGFRNRGIDLALEGAYRETNYIEAAIDFVVDNMLLGAGLAVLVLVVFLRSPTSVLIVGLAIPVSLMAVFLVLRFLDRSLNVISLAGIAFASGMVVDNAIVVLENVHRHLEMGKSRVQAAVDGGREVWGGVLASTLTTVAVFVPIVLQQDEASQLFKDMALAISAAVTLSLVVALTVVPVLASLLMREGVQPTSAGPAASDPSGGRLRSSSAPLGWMGRAYGALIAKIAARWPGSSLAKTGLVLGVAALAVASLALTPPAEYLPTGNRNLVMFFANPIPGTRPEAIAESFRPLEEFVLAQPETERMFAVTGALFNGGGVILKEEFATAEGLADFHGRMYGPSATLPGFEFVLPLRMSLFDDPGKQFEVEVSGPDFAVLEDASQKLSERLMSVSGVQFVRSSLSLGRPELRVSIDESRAKDLGLTVTDIGQFVETAIAGRRLTAMIEGGREVDVNVLVAQDRISSPEDLASLRFLSADGTPVTLENVANVERTIGPPSVRHLERQRSVMLTVNIDDETPLQTALEEIEGRVFPPLAAELGPAYALQVGGSGDKLKTTLASLSGGFGLSVLIIYLLLVALFRSWLSPFVILTTVPLALSGGLIGIRVAHQLSDGQASFDVIAMLGFVILAGLVVNNAILIVHQANNFRDEGWEPRAALVESARSRLRPILMSVITTVTAMVPLALGGGAGSELYQGLGGVIVGGLLVSTAFTLLLVPLLLSLGIDLAESLAGLRSGLGSGPRSGRRARRAVESAS